GTWDFDLMNNKVAWDSLSRELFGFGPDEHLSFDQVFRYADPADAPAIRETLKAVLHPGSAGEFELRFRVIPEDKGPRMVHCKGRAYFDHGVASRLAGIIQDSTAGPAQTELAVTAGEMAEAAFNNSVVG